VSVGWFLTPGLQTRHIAAINCFQEIAFLFAAGSPSALVKALIETKA
jgi:hypothetical protein